MLSKILKLAKKLLDQGYAGKEAREKLAEMVAELKSEDRELVNESLEKVKSLPTNSKAEDGEDEDVEVDQEQVDEAIGKLFDQHAKRIENSIKSNVKTWMDKQKDLSEKKAGIYHPQVANKRKELSNKLRELTKAFLSGDTEKLKEMTTDAGSSPYAGYTVDSELSAEIRHLTTEYGIARREMMVVTLSKDSYDANSLATDVSTYWVDEGSTINSSEVVLDQDSLDLKKLGAIVTFTNELLEDTEIDLIAFVGSRVAEGFAQAEDEAFFKGEGTASFGSFTGLLEANDVNEVTMTGTAFSSVDADDLIDMIDKTPSGALPNAKFYMNRTILSYLRKLKDDQGDYIFQRPTDSSPATIWGYPVVLVEAMPTKDDSAVSTSFVLFGDLRRACILGLKASGLKMSMFNAGTVRNVADDGDINLITSDRQAVRWIERTGYIRILPTAVTKLTTAASSS